MAEDHGITWFVEKRIIDRLPEQGAELEIHMGDRGKWILGILPVPAEAGWKPVIRWFPPADPYMQAYRQEQERPE